MDSIINAKEYYRRDLIEYKIRLTKQDIETNFTDDSVDKQLNAVVSNMRNSVGQIIIVKEYIQQPGLMRRMYSKISKYKVFRLIVRILKKVKRFLQRFRIFSPVIRLAEKICR